MTKTTKNSTINVEVMYMKEMYIKSLQMIKILNIKNEKEYNKLLRSYLLLSAESLKYMSRTRRFRKIIKLAKEVAQTSFKIFVKLPKCNKIHDIQKIEHTKDKVIL